MSFGNKERGYIGGGWDSFFIAAAIFCGVVGWAVIELLLWLFSFVHISFGG
jgi:hypothetical protein